MATTPQLFGKIVNPTKRNDGRLVKLPALTLHFAVIDDRPELVGVEIGARVVPDDLEADDRLWRVAPGRPLAGELKPLSPAEIRGLGIGDVAKAALREWGKGTKELADGTFKMPQGKSVPRRWRAEARERLALAESVAPRPPGRPKDLDAEHFQNVARVYREGDALRRAPTAYVAEVFNVSHSTAAHWVSRCRYDKDPEIRGLLPGTDRGKAAVKNTVKRGKSAAKKTTKRGKAARKGH